MTWRYHTGQITTLIISGDEQRDERWPMDRYERYARHEHTQLRERWPMPFFFYLKFKSSLLKTKFSRSGLFFHVKIYGQSV